MKSPEVSVVMCVFNGENTVESAIKSILDQTFNDFEFIILDDGSSDSTFLILKKYQDIDSRIKLYSQKNTGLTKALNNAIGFASGKYIARQDADDISFPNRIEQQVKYLKGNPSTFLVGSNFIEEINGVRYAGKYISDKEIMKKVFLHNPFPHTSAMFLRSVFNELGGYDESFDTSQDFELWIRFAKFGQIAMLSDPLVERVLSSNNITKKRPIRQYINGLRARLIHPYHGYTAAFIATLYQIIVAIIPLSFVKIKRLIYNRYPLK
jgi:glycosyltransferase involved in cell wall biosynthesis